MAASKRKRSGSEPAPPALHELEAEVMDELWSQGEAPVRSVMNALNERASKERAYTTYMTIMARLHTKGVLNRRREGKTDFYAPKLDRDEFMASRARAEVEGLVAEYGDVALSHFAQQVASLDPSRRRALQRLARKG
ncbi:MAG TPA: BlaI/MecI/CopY family transcriptional regulator [Solirubrobacteraceae bacterium]|jgi:predicted transcriptional regulator|nr:BlaI/MecI/CopY family transcriptional regulator [Solirubrobacteraceae bacterium]